MRPCYFHQSIQKIQAVTDIYDTLCMYIKICELCNNCIVLYSSAVCCLLRDKVYTRHEFSLAAKFAIIYYLVFLKAGSICKFLYNIQDLDFIFRFYISMSYCICFLKFRCHGNRGSVVQNLSDITRQNATILELSQAAR